LKTCFHISLINLLLMSSYSPTFCTPALFRPMFCACFVLSVESASYTACSPGQYCEAGSSSETPCPSGTYSASTASSCSECPSDQPYSCTGADMCDENPCDRYFEIYEGDCTTDDEGTCIYSPNYPSKIYAQLRCEDRSLLVQLLYES
jgi:hypothetical protein